MITRHRAALFSSNPPPSDVIINVRESKVSKKKSLRRTEPPILDQEEMKEE
jgi:hypothetical protein